MCTENDPLHWCSHYTLQSVPAVWVQLLSKVLLGDSKDATYVAHGRTSARNMMPFSVSPDDFDPFTAPPMIHHVEKPVGSNRPLLSDFLTTTYSQSRETICPCSDGETFNQCMSNIGCYWSSHPNGTFSCTQKDENKFLY
jgi:hypothetical protein